MDRLLSKGYGDGHRAFLQAFLAHGTLTFQEARPILAAVFNASDVDNDGDVRPDQVTQEDFQDYVDLTSEAASLFDYEIRSTLHQVSEQRVYALVNTASDAQTQLATTYNAEELAFINRLLDGIFDVYNTPRVEALALNEMQAIKFARPSRRQIQDEEEAGAADSQPAIQKGLKHSEVEMVLASLVEGGWFEKSRSNFYAVSPRFLLELRSWLINTYNDAEAEPGEWQRIKFCEACKEMVTIGLRCSQPDCNLRLHDMCQETFWRTFRTQDCPKCSTRWTEDKYVGERAITMTKAYQKGRRRSGGRRSTLADDVVEQQYFDAEEYP